MFSRVVRSRDMISSVVRARDRWTKRVNDGNLYGIINCYADEHTFKGTLNQEVTTTMEALEDYFTRLGSKKPRVTFTSGFITNSNGTYIDRGYYTFIIPNDKSLFAEYVMSYKVIDGELKIVSHYSYLIK